MDTSLDYSPWDQLPVAEPKTVRPSVDHFYQHTAKHLIGPTVKLMMTGLPIDLDRVEDLESHLDEVLEGVRTTIENNRYVKEYLDITYKSQIEAYQAEQQSKLKDPSEFITAFKYNDPIHRSCFMDVYAEMQNITRPDDRLKNSDIAKWPANTVKKLAKGNPLLTKFIQGLLKEGHPLVDKAVQKFAEYKCSLRNRSYLEKIHKPNVKMPTFNPQSSVDKRGIFEMLGIPSEASSAKTGLAKWDRAQVERVNREFSDDPDLVELTQAMIDHSFAAIVRNNFIEAFYKYTVDGRLYGSVRLFGAKSFRPTSQNPNLLNMPSTGSTFAKPIKKCFTAPPGYVIATADYSALENRVIANLAKEDTLIKLYEDDLDGHCVNSLYYFREEIAEHIPLTGDLTVDAKLYASKLEEIPALKKIRQRGKGPSFGLQYGAYPPKIASTIKCSLEEAEQIFNRYHNELYPSVTKFREEYVAPTAKAEGKLHLGLGCYIKTDDPDRDIRTITNACSQFWSVLTLLSIAKVDQLITKAGLDEEIQCISTIYDSIYYICKDDPYIIKTLNETLVEAMSQDFLENQVTKNEVAMEIGPDWSELYELPNNASIEEIKTIRNKF